mmetsp:Transcript_22386/g.57425  ORF Transcript_22386/g.57425 Transcript_22386/m.57425 type:complete len:165 (-) Transcript_22386:2107-2601(-)
MTAAERAEEKRLHELALAQYGGERPIPIILYPIGALTGLISGLTGTAGNLAVAPLLMYAHEHHRVNMGTEEIVGQATATSMASTLLFTIGALFNTSSQFDLGLFLALLVPYCLGVPSGLAWHRAYHTKCITKALPEVIAYALAVVGLSLAIWALTAGPRAEDDD